MKGFSLVKVVSRIVVVLLLMPFLFSGCGKKANPVPPRAISYLLLETSNNTTQHPLSQRIQTPGACAHTWLLPASATFDMASGKSFARAPDVTNFIVVLKNHKKSG